MLRPDFRTPLQLASETGVLQMLQRFLLAETHVVLMLTVTHAHSGNPCMLHCVVVLKR